MAIEPSGGGALQRQQETSSLADVVGTILDKGVVVDIFARVSLVGIELLRVDARIVIASVDTYLRFAEAANRLELGTKEPEQLSDVVGDLADSGSSGAAKGKTKGVLEAGAEKLDEIVSPGDEDEEHEEARPRRKREESRHER
ncbi:MAG: gas vesicle protein [Solirubrobacterales bacterium]|nr:gas vesicle protein [Solirubrobacterales bacterium]